MSQAASQSRMSVEDYLVFERQAELRHEYMHGEIFAMSGGTWEHSLLAANLIAALGRLFYDRPCSVVTSDMRIKTADRYTYPDAAVVCGPAEFEDERRDTLLNPSVIIEVLSPTTEGYDRGDKFASYRTLPSLTDYVLIAQDQVRIEHFHRQPDDAWLLRVLGPGDALALDTAGGAVAVADIYRKIL